MNRDQDFADFASARWLLLARSAVLLGAGHHEAEDLAQATLLQLLSHSAGTTRDGPDAGQFMDRHPFLDKTQLMAQLAEAPPLEANTRFKYSNHGFALLGLVIEAVTGEPYAAWMQREIVDAAGLRHPQ